MKASAAYLIDMDNHSDMSITPLSYIMLSHTCYGASLG